MMAGVDILHRVRANTIRPQLGHPLVVPPNSHPRLRLRLQELK